MTLYLRLMLVSLTGMLVGWALALRALAQVSFWAALAGVGLLGLVAWGVTRAARI